MNIEDRAFILASGNYLCEVLTEEVMNDDEALYAFIEENIWKGVENLPTKEVIAQINCTADMMIRFHNQEKEIEQ